jgi:hypothetical protein
LRKSAGAGWLMLYTKSGTDDYGQRKDNQQQPTSTHTQ